MISEHLLTELKQKLEAEKSRLESELSEIATKRKTGKEQWDATYPVSDDDKSSSSGSMEEMGDEIEEYNTRLSEEATLEKRLQDIDNAFLRMENKTYGTCKVCNAEIPLERLQANPAAATDVQHASSGSF